MKIKKFDEINENASNIEVVKRTLLDIKNSGQVLDLNIVNNRLSLTQDGFNLFNTNNNQIGIQSLITFLQGFKFGLQSKS